MFLHQVSDSGGISVPDNSENDIEGALLSLCDHLQTRRDAILRAWRDALEADTALTSGRQLTRLQLLDHVPQLFDQLLQSLRSTRERSATDNTPTNVSEQEVEAAREHGVHRWQQGYSVWEVTREFGHFHLCVADEFALYAQTLQAQEPPQFGALAMHRAHRQLALLVNAGVEQSVEQFTRGREAEARTQMRNLEEVLTEFGETERARGQSLRAASHDLRGSLAVVEGTASLLRQTEEDELRSDLTDLMQRGVESLKRMMTDLLDLARLEAGEDGLRATSFDVAVLLRDLCEASQPLAHNFGLTLEASGPSLTVQGDAIKTQRIVQNLMLNALKYTQQGGVRIEWEIINDDEWSLGVIDTGGGLDSHQIAPLLAQVKEATQINREVEAQGTSSTRNAKDEAVNDEAVKDEAVKDEVVKDAANAPAAPTQSQREADLQERLHPGEGIGLTIVKRLCDLLDARLEVESNAEGSAFRVVFPRRYDGQHS